MIDSIIAFIAEWAASVAFIAVLAWPVMLFSGGLGHVYDAPSLFIGYGQAVIPACALYVFSSLLSSD